MLRYKDHILETACDPMKRSNLMKHGREMVMALVITQLAYMALSSHKPRSRIRRSVAKRF